MKKEKKAQRVASVVRNICLLAFMTITVSAFTACCKENAPKPKGNDMEYKFYGKKNGQIDYYKGDQMTKLHLNLTKSKSYKTLDGSLYLLCDGKLFRDDQLLATTIPSGSNIFISAFYVVGSDVYLSGSLDSYATCWKNGTKVFSATEQGKLYETLFVHNNDIFTATKVYTEEGHKISVQKNGAEIYSEIFQEQPYISTIFSYADKVYFSLRGSTKHSHYEYNGTTMVAHSTLNSAKASYFSSSNGLFIAGLTSIYEGFNMTTPLGTIEQTLNGNDNFHSILSIETYKNANYTFAGYLNSTTKTLKSYLYKDLGSPEKLPFDSILAITIVR